MKNKIISILVLASIICTLIPHQAHADTWGSNMMAAIWKQTMEEMYLKIKEMIIATLKMQAIRIVQARMMSLIGGVGTGGPKIVQNWRDEIYGSARQQSNLVVNDYFSQLRSRTPGPVGQKIVIKGEEMYRADYTNPNQLYPDIDKYEREGLLNSPNAFWPWFVKKAEFQNQPFAYSMTAEEKAALEYSETSGSESAKYQAYGGVKPTTVRGAVTVTSPTGGKYTQIYQNKYPSAEKITMPGSVIKDLMVKVQAMPIDMVALSRSIPEIVASMVTSMLTQMINRGISTVVNQISGQMKGAGQLGIPLGNIQNIIQSGGR